MKLKPVYKLRTLGLLIAVLCFGISLFGQDSEMDSLKLALKNAKSDTVRISTLTYLSENCVEEDILNYTLPCIKLCQKAIEANVAPKEFYLKHKTAISSPNVLSL